MNRLFSFVLFAYILLHGTAYGDLISDFTVLSTYSGEPGSRTMAVGGSLRDASGNLVNGTKTIQLSLYDSATGGLSLHTESFTSNIQNGAYSVQVGSSVALDPSLFTGYTGFNRFIELSVDGSTASTRQSINALGYSTSGLGFQSRFTSSFSAYTAEPGQRTLAFGGILSESGNRVTGNRSIQFDVYDSATGGNQLYSESATVSIQDGVLSHNIGTVNPLDASVFTGYDGYNRFLQVSVNGVASSRVDINSVGESLAGAGFELDGSNTISTYIEESGARTLSFGGILTDNSGQLINGMRNVDFGLYDSASGGNLLFSELHSASIQDGVMSFELGTITFLDPSVFTGYDGFNRYLQVSVNGTTVDRYLLNSSSGFFVSSVPEPSSCVLFGVAMLAIGRRRKRT